MTQIPQTGVRAPRAKLSIAGGDIWPLAVTVEQTSNRTCGTFEASVTLDGQLGINERYWSSLINRNVTVNATNDATLGSFVPKFVGNIDSVDISWEHRTVRLSGRDLLAPMLETKTNDSFKNRNVTSVVQDLAGRVGLATKISLPSTNPTGLKYGSENTLMGDGDVLFNILSRLAQSTGCVFFVVANTLYFMPASSLSGGQFLVNYVPPTPLTYASGNFIRLRTHRNYVLSPLIKVRTRSFQMKSKKVISSEYHVGGSGSGTLVFEHRAPNLAKEQSDQVTLAKINEIISREKTIEVEMPGDVTLDPTMQIVLAGTGTAFDQTYVLASVNHSWAQGDGYRMSFSARNPDATRTPQQASVGADQTSQS